MTRVKKLKNSSGLKKSQIKSNRLGQLMTGFKRLSRRTRILAVVFVLAFASLGSYELYQSFAIVGIRDAPHWNAYAPALRSCEGKWKQVGYDSRYGYHYGAYQFAPGTWNSNAGAWTKTYHLASDAPAVVQDQAAFKLFMAAGLGPWQCAPTALKYQYTGTDDSTGGPNDLHDSTIECRNPNFPNPQDGSNCHGRGWGEVPGGYQNLAGAPSGAPTPGGNPGTPATPSTAPVSNNCTAHNFPASASAPGGSYCVQQINVRLKAWGYPADPNSTSYNQSLVVQFQTDRRSCLTPDGVVGPQTWSYLMGRVCSGVSPAPTNVDRYVPFGWLDTGGCNTISGWAYDPDNPSASISVDLYFDGQAGSGAYMIRVTAGDPRPDVNNAMHISGNHGFHASAPHNYASHSVFAYGIDWNEPANLQHNAALNGNPKYTEFCSPNTGFQDLGQRSRITIIK